MASSSKATITARAALPGLALAALVLALLAGPGAPGAGAATLEPCKNPGPEYIVERDGQLNLTPLKRTRKAWRKRGIRQSLLRPANALTGRPTYPVKSVRYGNKATVALKGGFELKRGRRSLGITGLKVVTAPGRPALVRGKVRKRVVNLFKVRGGRREYSAGTGELSRTGTARLTPAGARVINRNLRTGRRKLGAGTVWGAFNLYSLYKVTERVTPTGKVSPVPPVKSQPPGTVPVQGTTLKWYVRDSFIDYVATGGGTRAEDGATPDPPTGPKSLVYSYDFPFRSGWSSGPETDADAENALIEGTGTVGFRYCKHTINFTASDPEIEIDGDDRSRIIFRVNGTEGTAYPNQRVVMVKLLPSLAEEHTVTEVAPGEYRVEYVKIPGFIPAESTGIFAGFFPAFNPANEGIDPRPDRFGYVTVAYTYQVPA